MSGITILDWSAKQSFFIVTIKTFRLRKSRECIYFATFYCLLTFTKKVCFSIVCCFYILSDTSYTLNINPYISCAIPHINLLAFYILSDTSYTLNKYYLKLLCSFHQYSTFPPGLPIEQLNHKTWSPKTRIGMYY